MALDAIRLTLNRDAAQLLDATLRDMLSTTPDRDYIALLDLLTQVEARLSDTFTTAEADRLDAMLREDMARTCTRRKRIC